MGWDLLDPNLAASPLGGDAADYLAAAAHTAAAAEAIAGVAARAVGALDVRRATGWHGEAATALGTQVTAWSDTVRLAATVLDALAAVCTGHADQLADLRSHAASALAVAQARYDDLRAGEAQLAGARDELHRTDVQLAWLRGRAAADDPATAVQVGELERRRRYQHAGVAWWHGQVAERTTGLAAGLAQHAVLHAAEQQLVARTARAMYELPLDRQELPKPVPAGVFAGVGALARAAEATLGTALAGLAATLAERLLPFPLTGGRHLVQRWLAAFTDRPLTEQLALVAAFGELYHALGNTPPRAHAGDPGGTYEWAWRGRWHAASGVGAVADALALTIGARTLAPDEFGVVELGEGRYIVVLPGVTDLRRPSLGLHPGHRTVRDLDAVALRSSRSTAVADNRYAQMVAAGLAEFGVAPGNELLIVGHSFGADTALDLAADPRFNGPAGYAVTHVVAAGYHSSPQLAHVPDRTGVLVLQNAHDLVIELGRLGEHPVGAAYELGDLWEELGSGEVFGAVGSLTGVANHTVGFGGYLIEEYAASGGGAPPIVRFPRRQSGGQLSRVGVRTPTDRQVVSVFDGGRTGMGHHQSNYLDYLASHRDEAVDEFAAALADAGYTGRGDVFAIDVSVPESPRGSR
ncbi:MAG TPA: hypothetical protein VNQ73_20835 [Ilumatobacter sp.]|nr:hypothetical protein [Ilumatobacter sp.]